MAANAVDIEIRKYLSMLGADEKRSVPDIIKGFLRTSVGRKDKEEPEKSSSSIDYSRYRFPASTIKFNRDEINER